MANRQSPSTQSKTARLREEQRQKERRKKRSLLLSAGGLVIILTVAVVLVTRSPGGGTSAQAVNSGESLVIPAGDISATAKYYPVTVDGTKMEVIAVKAPDGTIRTAFNTCQVCYDSGRGYYKQEGDVLVCQNCGNRFKMSQVEITKGGCNPWPIFNDEKTVTAETITISYDFLKESRQIFANWKQS